jgi:hypothetical protein
MLCRATAPEREDDNVMFELAEEQTHEVEEGLRVGQVYHTTYMVPVSRTVEFGTNTTTAEVHFDPDYPRGSADVSLNGKLTEIPLSRLPACRKREDVARWAVVAALKREQEA